MNRHFIRTPLFILFLSTNLSLLCWAGLREKSSEEPAKATSSEPTDSDAEMDIKQATTSTEEDQELLKAKEAMRSMEGRLEDQESTKATKAKKASSKYYRRAEAFVAGTDWEFDGFVAGGQDQEIKSMFATNDLLYLNIGSEQGLAPGVRLGIYRRGDRIRDPQSNKLIGFEVRKVAVAEVTERVDGQTCSSRVIKSFESVELGDLVRREE